MHGYRLFCFLLVLLALLAGCSSSAAQPTDPTVSTEAMPVLATEPSSEPVPTDAAPTLLTIESLVDQMTLRQKVGQLFIIRPDALVPSLSEEQISDPNAEGVTDLTGDMVGTLQDYPVGGIIMFAKNITDPEQIMTFNQALQDASGIPLFIAVDEEGGLVSRLATHEAFRLPRYKSAASIQNAEQALEMGSTIGSYLKDYGFNMDFAPVADVNTNPKNPIIGTRAFSSDPETAAQLASSMARGLHWEGITPVFKHFPGHGDTAEDSHSQLAISYQTKDGMLTCEWLPFLEAGSGDCIMVGHIAVPEITGDLTPATMSSLLVTDILKTELGFQGLVITDSLEMGAITDAYTSGEAALKALEAGCDILLMPRNLRAAFDAVVAAVENGTYSEETLNATVIRILRFKQEQGLLGAG